MSSAQTPNGSRLQVLGKGQGYLKAGFLGFNKSGKTYTAARLAVGLRQFFGLKSRIAMYDSEGGSEYIAPMIREATGTDLIGYASQSLADLIGLGRECVENGIEILIADSITHPWRELCRSYLAEVNRKRAASNLRARTKLEFQDWTIIKERWEEWNQFYLNSRLHIIVCGRAGYDYDLEQNEETGRKELIKTGVKMKTEGEFGFEPSLLVEMERVQDLTGEHTKVKHRAVVIGDRFGKIDGAVCDNPDFEFFKPHVQMLVPGAHAPIDTRNKTITGYDDDGNGEWNHEKRQRAIYCEEIQGLLVEKWPGQSADEKASKLALLEKVFATRSWTNVEGLPSDQLKAGLEAVRSVLRPAPEPVEQEFVW